MLMSLLVIRVLYLLFDSAANGLARALHRLLGVRPDQMIWLIGDYREEKEDQAGSRDRTTDRSSPLIESAPV